jgi:hypothetical protein
MIGKTIKKIETVCGPSLQRKQNPVNLVNPV